MPLVQVAVCTPGRMIDLIKMKACNMLRATYLVFDEADRMFDMGFEPQVSAGREDYRFIAINDSMSDTGVQELEICLCYKT